MAEVSPDAPTPSTPSAPSTPSTFVHRPGDAWEAEAELAVSSVLVIELHPAGGYRWSSIESSDSAVASVSGAVDGDGVARFIVVGKTSGAATVSASTEHVGDRFGPQTRRWTLRLRVLGKSHAGY